MSHIWPCICIFPISLTKVIWSVISGNFLHWTVFLFSIHFIIFSSHYGKHSREWRFSTVKCTYSVLFGIIVVADNYNAMDTAGWEKALTISPTTYYSSCFIHTWSIQTLWWPDIQTEVWWRLDVKLRRVCILPKICAMFTWPIILSLIKQP